jgi:hypothetical protein
VIRGRLVVIKNLYVTIRQEIYVALRQIKFTALGIRCIQVLFFVNTWGNEQKTAHLNERAQAAIFDVTDRRTARGTHTALRFEPVHHVLYETTQLSLSLQVSLAIRDSSYHRYVNSFVFN